MCVDTIFLATGLVIENGGALTANASWLRLVHEYRRINMAELDSVLFRVKVALQWNAREGRLQRDSECVHRWISDTLSRKMSVRTKVASEVSPQHGAGIGCKISAADRGGAPQTHHIVIIVSMGTTSMCWWMKAV